MPPMLPVATPLHQEQQYPSGRTRTQAQHHRCHHRLKLLLARPDDSSRWALLRGPTPTGPSRQKILPRAFSSSCPPSFSSPPTSSSPSPPPRHTKSPLKSAPVRPPRLNFSLPHNQLLRPLSQ